MNIDPITTAVWIGALTLCLAFWITVALVLA